MAEKKPARKAETETMFRCALPPVPEKKLPEDLDPRRSSLIRKSHRKWVNGTVLHYCFLDRPRYWEGDTAQKNAVRNAFNEWKSIGIGLRFSEVTNSNEAEIRIGFEPGSSWSYIGRDAIDRVPNPSQRTMNFGWDVTTSYGRDTALHEIGHALAFPHEHQNPKAGIIWNEEAVYRHFAGSPNYWDRKTTFHNVLRKIDRNTVEGSKWDKNSIMHYQFEAGLIDIPEEFRANPLVPKPGLSKTDISETQKFYPEVDDSAMPELAALRARTFGMEEGLQKDFEILPEMSRKYVVQTLGGFDGVLVVFEEDGGDLRYLSGDEAAGTDDDAQVNVRLTKGKRYVARLRIYATNRTDEGAIILI